MPLSIQQTRDLITTLHARTVALPPAELDVRKAKDFDSLSQILINKRSEQLNAKSSLVQFNGQLVRVYPEITTNVTAQVDDVYGRGLDHARAVSEILQRAGRVEVAALLVSCISRFEANMQKFRDDDSDGLLPALTNAEAELRRFNSALCDLLADSEICKDKKHALKAITFVRDFLWKKDMATPVCVITKKQGFQNIFYAEPMRFDSNTTATQTKLNYWDNEQTWKKQLRKSLGDTDGKSWMNAFFDAHLSTMKTLSSTPMSRFTPNPANAYDCNDIILNERNEIISLDHYTSMAVTDPLTIKNKKTSQGMTTWNHFQLLDPKRLQREVSSYLEQWDGILDPDANSIPFAILHQTLIGDEVTFSADQSKSKSSHVESSVINSKKKANRAILAFLKENVVVRNKRDGAIRFVNRSEFVPTATDQIIDVTFLQTNNCINMWNKRARVRNNDFTDARRLVTHANHVLQMVSARTGTPEELTAVMEFLDSSNHSLILPYKLRGSKLKGQIKSLTEKLHAGSEPFNRLSAITRDNIATTLNAAVELKCTVNETWAGSARRRITNFTRTYFRVVPVLGHILDWTVRGTLSILAFAGKILSGVIHPIGVLPRWIGHLGDRKEVVKANFEGILAESLGILQGGCMSSADRGNEIIEQRRALKILLHKTHTVVGYNDNHRKKRDFLETYGSTRTKHAFVEACTGTQGTADRETRGFFFPNENALLSSAVENKEEKALAKKLYSLRKAKYDPKMSMSRYLIAPSVRP